MIVSRNGIEFEVFNNQEWFEKHFKDGGWEQPTFNVIENFANHEKVYLDIGSWIGPMAMFSSYKELKEYFKDTEHAQQFQM
jgi:hypothetical protein